MQLHTRTYIPSRTVRSRSVLHTTRHSSFWLNSFNIQYPNAIHAHISHHYHYHPYSRLSYPNIESNEPLIYDPTLKSKRGGLCIHRPSILASEPMNPPTTHTHDEYLTFCRNLTSQTPKDHNHTVARADHLWKDALENHIFRAMKVVVRVQEKKKGRKRKLEQSESGVSIATSADSSVSGVNGNVNANGSLESARQSLVGMDVDDCGGDADSCVVRDVALGMESDDRMLEYLQVNGSGKAKRAQFLMIVELCRGTGRFTVCTVVYLFELQSLIWFIM